jgi:hypothetical protein
MRFPSISSSDSSSCPIISFIRSERRPNSMRRSLAMRSFRYSISASRATSSVGCRMSPVDAFEPHRELRRR